MSQFNYKTDVGDVLANYRRQNTAKLGDTWEVLVKLPEYLAVQRQIALMVKGKVPEADKLQKAFDALKKEGKRQMFEMISGGTWTDFETLKKNFEVIKKGVEKLLAQRKAEVAKKVDDCKTADDATKMLKDTLTDEDIQIAGADVQAKLLKRLRDPNVDVEGDPKLLKAVEKLYKNMAFSDKYVEKSKELENEVVEKLKDKAATAKKNWSTCSPEDKEKFLNEVLKIQSEAQKKATGLDVPVLKVEMKDLEPTLSGQFKAGPPKTMEINKNNLDDFREVLDTVLHENTHNMQRSMLEEVDKITDPGLKQQAEVFKLNTNNGYVANSDSSAYRDQPKERDAWGFAGRVMDQMLGPQIK